jgi:uncharacterized protein involved in outer membrane biogenesis
MRWGRILLILVIGLVTLVVVALAFAPTLLNLEQIKERVVNRVERQLNRDVELGEVRLELFNGLGAGLEKLTIANPKGWQSPYFVKVDTLSIKVALIPLLSRKIEVSKLILDTGEIVIERDAQGRLNYDDLKAAPSSPAPAADESVQPSQPPVSSDSDAPSGPSPLAGLLVSRLALNHIDVKFIDQMVAPGETITTVAHNINLEADNIRFNTPIEFDLSGAMLTDGEANVRLRGQVGPVPDHDDIDLQHMPLQLTLKATTLPLAPVTPYLGATSFPTAGELSSDIAVEGTLSDGLRMQGTLSLDKATMPDTAGHGQPVSLPAITLTQNIALHFADAKLTITKAQVDLGALHMTLVGSVKQFDTPSPQLELSLHTSNVALADVVNQWPILATALPVATETQGNVALQATVKGTPEHLHITSQVDARPLTTRLSDGTPITLSNVQFDQVASLNLAQSRITLSQAKLDLGFLQGTMQGTIANFDSTPQLDLQVKTSNFNPASVLSHLPMLAETLPKPADLQGDIQLQATLKGTPHNLSTDAQITSQSLSLKSGSFHGGTPANGGMRMDLAKVQTNLKAQLRTPAPPTVHIDIDAKRFAFDQKTADQKAPSTPSTAPAPGQAPPPAPSAARLPPLNLQGKVNLAEGSVTGVAFQNLRAVFSIINGLVKSQHDVQMFGGTYQGTLTANLAQPKPDYQLTMDLAKIRAGEVANTFTSTPNMLFGQLNSNLNLNGKGFDWRDISTHLTGNGKLNLTDFKLTTLDIMPKLATGLSAVSTLAGFRVPNDLSTRSFDKLSASLQIQDGKVRSDDLKLWGPDVQLLGKGLVGLDRSLAFDGTVVLLDQLARSLGKEARFLMDKKGRIHIPLTIHGTVTEPRMMLNEKHLANLAQRALSQQVKQEAGQEVQKLLDQVIPGTSPPDKGGERTDPLKQLNQTLKGLFNR